jgi:DNA-binding response OmpR family regulator
MPKTIAVVDDSSTFQDLCARILKPAGYECVPIAEAERTVDEVKRIRPDLLMMDLRLGEWDGVSVLNALNSDPEVTGIPVVICTAAHDLVEKHRALLEELGCEIIEKPFDIDDLIGAIERCLARAAERAH